MQPQFANIATPSEIVVSTAFQLEIGDISGSIHICMPYATLEPIRDVLYSSTQGDSIEVDRRWVKVLKREIQAAEVTLVAELARADATVEQLLAMRPGDFIELDREPLIRASIGGVPILPSSKNRVTAMSHVCCHTGSWIRFSCKCPNPKCSMRCASTYVHSPIVPSLRGFRKI